MELCTGGELFEKVTAEQSGETPVQSRWGTEVVGMRPPGGFPEPMRTNTLKGRTLPDGRECYEGRPGAELGDYNLEEATELLRKAYGAKIRNQDVMSYAMYPEVFKDYQEHNILYGDMGKLPTHIFLNPMKVCVCLPTCVCV